METDKLVELITSVIISLIKAGIIELKQPIQPTQQLALPMVPTKRKVICLEDVRGISSEDFYAAQSDMLTPLARDYLKEHGIRIHHT